MFICIVHTTIPVNSHEIPRKIKLKPMKIRSKQKKVSRHPMEFNSIMHPPKDHFNRGRIRSCCAEIRPKIPTSVASKEPSPNFRTARHSAGPTILVLGKICAWNLHLEPASSGFFCPLGYQKAMENHWVYGDVFHGDFINNNG